MNGTDSQNSNTRHDPENDALAVLFRQVSARKPPPAQDEQLIRRAVHEQWQEINRRRRRKKWAWALAASIVAVVVTAVRISPPAPDTDVTVASIEKVIGTVVAHSITGPTALNPGTTHDMKIGLTLKSGTASGLGLKWMNGTFIRLDENTELELLSKNEVFLRSGRVYLDTNPGQQDSEAIVVRTPQGLVRHVGTQFMTQWSASGLLISIREGEVMYQPLPGSHQDPARAGRGQRLEVSPGGTIGLEPITTWGADWSWTEALSPGFQSDGRSLTDLFTWAGRELGMQVKYTSSSAESLAATTVLHGNLDVQPLRALSVATVTSDLSARVSDGRIVIALSESP